MNKLNLFIVLLGLWLSQTLWASSERTFSSEEQAQQYEMLLKELRCMTCPNQSIADSQAMVAKAMQEEIYQQLCEGQSVQSIRDYLLSRYGDYVTYRPLVKKQTYVLWFGPALFLLVGMGLWGYFIRKRG